jgi:nitronate monooxygenase
MISVVILDDVATPVVLAPMAGGPSTPLLAAGVAEGGAFPFLAAGYLDADALADRLKTTRQLTAAPFGVNLFVPGRPGDASAVPAYADLLAGEAERLGVELGEPHADDDHWAAKLDLLGRDPVPVVSFTFGCPPREVVSALRRAGSEVWVTVTTPDEAAGAGDVGADVLVAQGVEAGGHRGSWDDDDPEAAGLGVLSLVQLVRARTALPVVAAGGIMTGAGIAAALAAGARAAALGTAFLRCPEAGTSPVHRQALTGTAPTALTRAFSGRTARGIRNRFMTEYGEHAPAAYPELHFLTAPLRAAGRDHEDADVVSLWAGQAYPLGRELPAAELVRALAAELAATSAR